MTLYDRIGGEPALHAAVELFYEKMLADPATAAWFDGVMMEQLKAHQRAFLAVGLGGPESYSARSMRSAHSGLRISNDDYDVALAHLRAALTELEVEPGLIAQVMKPLELMRPAIVAAR